MRRLVQGLFLSAVVLSATPFRSGAQVRIPLSVPRGWVDLSDSKMANVPNSLLEVFKDTRSRTILADPRTFDDPNPVYAMSSSGNEFVPNGERYLVGLTEQLDRFYHPPHGRVLDKKLERYDGVLFLRFLVETSYVKKGSTTYLRMLQYTIPYGETAITMAYCCERVKYARYFPVFKKSFLDTLEETRRLGMKGTDRKPEAE